MNEAFSDIMATGVEFYFQAAGSGPLKADYLGGGGRDHSRRAPLAAEPRVAREPRPLQRALPGLRRQRRRPHQLRHPRPRVLPRDRGRHPPPLRVTVQGVGAANRDQIEKVFYRAFTSCCPRAPTSAWRGRPPSRPPAISRGRERRRARGDPGLDGRGRRMKRKGGMKNSSWPSSCSRPGPAVAVAADDGSATPRPQTGPSAPPAKTASDRRQGRTGQAGGADRTGAPLRERRLHPRLHRLRPVADLPEIRGGRARHFPVLGRQRAGLRGRPPLPLQAPAGRHVELRHREPRRVGLLFGERPPSPLPRSRPDGLGHGGRLVAQRDRLPPGLRLPDRVGSVRGPVLRGTQSRGGQDRGPVAHRLPGHLSLRRGERDRAHPDRGERQRIRRQLRRRPRLPVRQEPAVRDRRPGALHDRFPTVAPPEGPTIDITGGGFQAAVGLRLSF